MLGLGISLARGAFASIVTYVRDNLKLFFNFKIHQDNPITHASSGSTSFDGTDDYVDLGDDTSLDITSSITISAWVKMNQTNLNSQIIARDDGSNRNYGLMAWGDAKLYFDFWSGGTLAEVGSTTTYNANTWYHVCGTYDGVNQKIYVNGLLEDSDAETGSIDNDDVSLSIGAREGGVDRYFNGSICQVGIWSRALSASEVQGVMYKKYADLSSAEQVSLVSWYGLDADYNDAHGSNNGTNSGSTLTASVYGGNAPQRPRIFDSAPDVVDNYGTLHSGTALSFDGTNDYVDAGISPRALVGSSSAFSVSAWINMDDDTNEYICGAMESGAERFYLRVVDASGIGYLRWGYGDSSSSDTDGVISLNEWHHVIWTYDTTNAKIYIDGELKNTTAVSGKTITNTDNLYIGVLNSNGTPANYLDGKISSFKIFNSALTLAQIQEMYLNPEQILPTGVASSNFKLWLPLQEGSGTTNYDGSGNNNDGTISGATWVKAETEIAQVGLVRQNKPMVFDGSDDYVDLPDAFFDVSERTVSLWFYANSLQTAMLFAGGTGSPNRWYMYPQSDGTIDTGIGSQDPVASSIGYSAKQWTHYVVTYDGAFGKTYINGELGSNIADATLSGSLNVNIGAYNNGASSLFDGLISETAVWDEALTATEVTALYNSGTPLDATADSGNYASSDGLVGYWRNDGDTTWTDRSTNSNNGTVAGSPTSIVLTEGITSGRDSQGFFLTDTDENVLSLNGAEYVEVPDSDTLSFGDGSSDSPFSIEAWVKMNDATGFRIVGKGVYNTDGEYSFGVANDDRISIQLYDESLASTRIVRYHSTLLTPYEGQWIHVVATYDGRGGASAGGGLIMYLNNAVLTTASADAGTYVAMENLDADVYVGKSDTMYSDGQIDDVRIYSKALSSAEVTKNYNAGLSKH